MKKYQKIQLYILLISLFTIISNGCIIPSDDDPANCTNTAVFNPSLVYGTMTDQEGNTYKTITIGTQTWMAENLRTTIYRDGSSIPKVTDDKKWVDLVSGAQCSNKKASDNNTVCTFGILYNWYTVSDNRNIAPEGWHVPTDEEWGELRSILGGEAVAGGKMRETGNLHWDKPNGATEASNASGFTALPSGSRGASNGIYSNLTNSAHYWSSSQYDASNAWNFSLSTSYDTFRGYSHKNHGYAIRCIKD
ncbi:MAG TPA: hypothetical protein DCX89_06470 [Saprospirales bacterium]|nr:hypothetical protein [Saprospirales bacterium]HAY71516.1 hypothetical protein [Saprospirales bacterium]HRQ29876.1 fibrobacter succinogenes major paralogous domain-containing protein [Saprospiraceae bacterium]